MMRTLILALLLFSAVIAEAQKADTLAKNVSNNITIVDAKPLTSYNKFSYIIDNKLYTNKTFQKRFRDTVNLLEIEVIKGAEAKVLYGDKVGSGVVVLTHLSYAISQYQKKFGNLSKEYKSYLSSHGNDDSSFLYVLNDDLIDSKTLGEFVLKLYKIPVEDITQARFLYNPTYDSGSYRPALFITTKKP